MSNMNPAGNNYRNEAPNNRPLDRDEGNDTFSNDEEDDDVCCAKCQARPEDVLILTCDHNLCLACASNNLHEQ